MNNKRILYPKECPCCLTLVEGCQLHSVAGQMKEFIESLPLEGDQKAAALFILRRFKD